MITQQQLNRTYNYQAYKELLVSLLQKEQTTGHDQSASMVSFTRLNMQRMQRVEQTTVITEKLRDAVGRLKEEFIWLVLTEGWCGDAAHSVPLLNIVAGLSSKLKLKLMLRDDNPDVMEQFLTDGARSIPKMICLEKESLREVFVWGPRPAELQKIARELADRKATMDEKSLIIQKWYNSDKSGSVQREITALMEAHMTG